MLFSDMSSLRKPSRIGALEGKLSFAIEYLCFSANISYQFSIEKRSV